MASTNPGVSRHPSATGVSQRRHRSATHRPGFPQRSLHVPLHLLCRLPPPPPHRAAALTRHNQLQRSRQSPCQPPPPPRTGPHLLQPLRDRPQRLRQRHRRRRSRHLRWQDQEAPSGGLPALAPHQRQRQAGPGSFRTVKQLGEGSIGRVILAELRGMGGMFALKVMNKRELEVRRRIGRAETVREILRQLDHPFLPTLYSYFETDHHFCLVMDYCPGGDLNRLRQLQDEGRFSEKAARFYAAEVVLALEYLHMLGIIYRDPKPENVLIREDGHIMLSDFALFDRQSLPHHN